MFLTEKPREIPEKWAKKPKVVQKLKGGNYNTSAMWFELTISAHTFYSVSQKSEPPKHFAITAANLRRFK